MSNIQPLYRPKQGRLVSGVSAGIALHLGVPAWRMRLVIALFCGLSLGIGIPVYFFMWLLMAQEGSPQRPADTSPWRSLNLTTLTNAVKRSGNTGSSGTSSLADAAGAGSAPTASTGQILAGMGQNPAAVVGGFALLAAALIGANLLGVPIMLKLVVPALILISGLYFLGLQAEIILHEISQGVGGWFNLGRLWLGIVGIGSLALGVLLLLRSVVSTELLLMLISAGLILACALAVTLPWMVRLLRKLETERVQRAREAARADVAVHLHDSVLHTLSLVQRRSEEPAVVRSLARAQERELRKWLYQERTTQDVSLAQQIKDLIAEAEDAYLVSIECVIVGDCAPSENLEAVAAATREAVRNACVHGATPITVYAELSATEVEVFVRDRGKGFDVDSLPADRMGVKNSILGRMRQHGGTAAIRSNAERGTEVSLTMRQGAEIPDPQTDQLVGNHD